MGSPIDDGGQIAVRGLLERNAGEKPDAVFATFEDGTVWTRRYALETACAAANELRRAGVRQGDHVAVAYPNSPDFIRAVLGVLMAGGVVIPVNTAYRGAILEHLVHLAKPKVIVADGTFAGRIAPLDVDRPLVISGQDLLGADTSLPVLGRPVENWDTMALCLTSGTTGPSKLARLAYAQTLSGGNLLFRNWGATEDDVYLADMALFHSSGMYFIHSVLACRTSIAVRSRPNLASYWEVARETGATIVQFMSTMVTYLEQQPLRAAQKEHNIRVAMVVPIARDIEAFKQRFNIPNIHISWASTEVPAATCAWPGQKVVQGYCGQVRPGWQVRLADENDNEVPIGEPGEALVRSDQPWLIASEYVGNPAATASAWRNGWFHTGDMLRRDEEGNFFFVDRAKDAIRRRGQNISSFEVEKVLVGYPGIAEAACVPERSGVEVEEEVKAWLVLAEGATVDFAELLAYCIEQLPHYMVPRYFEPIQELPKTPSLKVQKYELRARGNGNNTWDRVAHGMDVTRFGLQRPAETTKSTT